MIKQEWVNKEEIQIDRDLKSRRRINETLDFVKLVALLSVVFFYTTSVCANAITDEHSVPDVSVLILDDAHVYVDDGIWFQCKNCRTCQWQASWKADWRGEYFCVRCGEKYK